MSHHADTSKANAGQAASVPTAMCTMEWCIALVNNVNLLAALWVLSE